uniref:(northern house mosquito) hypothetical protein n=1 Tax=Culex pipiens TaxID=7175 RepID=A0A8D8FU55_CULPI
MATRNCPVDRPSTASHRRIETINTSGQVVSIRDIYWKNCIRNREAKTTALIPARNLTRTKWINAAKRDGTCRPICTPSIHPHARVKRSTNCSILATRTFRATS